MNASSFTVVLESYGHPLEALWESILNHENRRTGGQYERVESEQIARDLQARAVEKAVREYPMATDFPRFEAVPLWY